MNVIKASLLVFLEGRKQFTLPKFQRRYSWETSDCNQLWEDVSRIGTHEEIPSHFLGSIVSIGEGSAAFPKFRVIDGQQRLTTISLLISALGRAIEARNVEIEIDRNRLEGYYLFNDREQGELRYKQLLTQHDRDTLIELLETGETGDENSLLLKNYRFFQRKLRGVDLQTVYKGIEKLLIVDITLEPDSDNPQLIFESLNSTGRRLSQADLIRNYVLMGQDPHLQDRLYDIYWYPMEESYGIHYAKRFDLFIRDYLTFKTQQIPNKQKVYEDFKRFVEGERQQTKLEAIIQEIVDYSEHDVRIALLEEPDKDLLACLEDIHEIKVEVVFPVLLGIYEAYTRGRIEKADVIEIFRLIESYIFRRTVCDLPTVGLNKIFASMAKGTDKVNSPQELKDHFSRLSRSHRFPSNQEFKEAFIEKDFYNAVNRRNYLLRKLENHERKEPILVQDYTIEHVMPQNLSEEWQAELGGDWIYVHEKYIDTIGNLTLTGYNSELSNRPFQQKQEILGGFRDSPLRLNRGLAQVERWDEDAIRERAEMLLDKALEIWTDHGIDPSMQGECGGRWGIDDHHHLAGEKMDIFQQLRQHILNLYPSISEQINRHYIGYRLNTTFVGIVPQARRLVLYLKLPFADLNDPRGLCRDVTNIGTYFAGDVEVGISSVDELDYMMFLIRQALERQS